MSLLRQLARTTTNTLTNTLSLVDKTVSTTGRVLDVIDTGVISAQNTVDVLAENSASFKDKAQYRRTLTNAQDMKSLREEFDKMGLNMEDFA